MKIGKINTKLFQQYIEETDLSTINCDMLLILARMVNEYLKSIETESLLIESVSREGNKRIKKHPLADSIIPMFNTISKILKDNNLTIPKGEAETEEDEFENLMKNLTNNSSNQNTDVN